MLGFDWANRHHEAVRGIAYMEGIVRQLRWSDWPEPVARFFQALRTPAGERMVLEENIMVERISGTILRQLSEAEMAEYRRPFAEPGEGRRPMLSWQRQIPVEGEPADVAAVVDAYAEWLRQCPLPKLFISCDPGALLTGEQRDFCRTWPAQTEVTACGMHYPQEDSPAEISTAIATWLEGRR